MKKHLTSILTFGVILLFVISVIWYDNIANYLFNSDGFNNRARGEFLNLILLIIGGGGAIYGLYLNNKRIKQQTNQIDLQSKQIEQHTKQVELQSEQIQHQIKQNQISEKSVISTRFKDAAMLLGREDTASIISGIYALHQISLEVYKGDDEEQKSYIKTIHDILCTYVREGNVRNGDKIEFTHSEIVLQTIIDVLFKDKGDIYGLYISNLSSSMFYNINFSESVITNANFSESIFHNSTFVRAIFSNVRFIQSDISQSFFNYAKFTDLDFFKANIQHSNFESVLFNYVSFKSSILSCLFFSKSEFNTTMFIQTDINDIDFKSSMFFNPTFENVKFKQTSFRKEVAIKQLYEYLPQYNIYKTDGNYCLLEEKNELYGRKPMLT